jgi:hypothetical protein
METTQYISKRSSYLFPAMGERRWGREFLAYGGWVRPPY